jgi:hypothetical protein
MIHNICYNNARNYVPVPEVAKTASAKATAPAVRRDKNRRLVTGQAQVDLNS